MPQAMAEADAVLIRGEDRISWRLRTILDHPNTVVHDQLPQQLCPTVSVAEVGLVGKGSGGYNLMLGVTARAASERALSGKPSSRRRSWMSWTDCSTLRRRAPITGRGFYGTCRHSAGSYQPAEEDFR